MSIVVAALLGGATPVNANLVLHEPTDVALDKFAACDPFCDPLHTPAVRGVLPCGGTPWLFTIVPAVDVQPEDEDIVLMSMLDDFFDHHPATWEDVSALPAPTISPITATRHRVMFEPLDDEPVFGAVVVPLPTSLQLALAGIGIMFLARRIRW